MFSCLDAAQQSARSGGVERAEQAETAVRAARPRKFLYYRTRRSAGTAVTAAYVSLTWEPGWEVVEKANARALERGVVAVGVEGVAVHIARGGCPAE